MKKLYLFLGLCLFSFSNCLTDLDDSFFGTQNSSKGDPKTGTPKLKSNDECLQEIKTLQYDPYNCKIQCKEHGDLAYNSCKDAVVLMGDRQEIKTQKTSDASTTDAKSADGGPSETKPSENKE